nr:hypothetical protein [Tanacetum cinerariifolium]
VDIDEDENEPELTYPYEEMDPLNPPPPASKSEPEDAIEVENPIKHEDEIFPTSVHEVCESSTAPLFCKDIDGLLPGTAAMEKVVEKLGNAEDKENVDAAIATERAKHVNVGNDARGSRPVRGQDAVPTAHECTFARFIKCNPTTFHGTKGVVGLVRWFEKTESVFRISECAEGKKRFNELPLMCPRMVEPKRVKVDAYIRGLTDNIKGEVTSSRLANLNEAVRMAHKLMDQKAQARNEKILEGKKDSLSQLRSDVVLISLTSSLYNPNAVTNKCDTVSSHSPRDVATTTSTASDGTGKKKGMKVTLTTDDMQKRKNNVKGRITLLLSLPDKHQLRFIQYKTAQELWAAILKTFGAEGSETLEQTFNRLQRNKGDLDTMSLDDLYKHLKVYESEVQKKSEPNSQNMAFISLAKHNNGNKEVNIANGSIASINVSTASANIEVASISQDTTCAYIASQSSGSQIKFEDINQIDEDDIKDMDIKWNMALLSMRADRFWKKTGKKISIQGTDVAGFDKSKVECFNYHKMGYFARECRAPKSQDRGRRDNYKQGSKVEEQAPKALMATDGDLSWTGLLEFADDTVTDYSRPSPTIESTLDDAQNRNPYVTETEASPTTFSPKPFIKFMKATDRSTETRTAKVETAKPHVKKFPTGNTKFSTADMGNKGNADSSQNNIDDKGYWDSGCSRQTIGNISYLSDYKPFDGGYVSFVQGGCKITNKGTIKTGKLEFENVYFLKDLKYNLFSVSQICDNKNSVLFTDSEWIVFGRNFKLSDDTNVLLRTPRQHNMYSIKLNNIILHKDLTCLVAKASADEGTKDAASQEVKKDVSSLRYNTLPNWVHDALLESSSCTPQDDYSTDVPESSGNYNPTATLINPSADQVETLTVETLIPTTNRFEDILGVTTNSDELNGVEADDPKFLAKVYKVEKAMYGLHQAPRAWQRGNFILVQVYVDDIIFGSSNPQLCREFEALMHEKFQMSAMDVRSSNTPMDKQNPWGKDKIGNDVDLHLYRSMIGSLMHLTAYRPDIMFAVCAYARHQVTPKEYSDYGGATEDCKSTTRGSQFLGRRLISWHCKKQTIVATSITKAEYVAVASGCGQVLWIQNQLLDNGLSMPCEALSKEISSSILRLIETTEERTKILATVDGKLRTVFESSIRRNLKLNDEEGIRQFSHQWKYLIHTIMQCLSPKSTGFNEFSSNIATALVCLATNRVYNFSKMIFDGMEKNVNNKVSKFLMYPRFLSKCLKIGQFGQIPHTQTVKDQEHQLSPIIHTSEALQSSQHLLLSPSLPPIPTESLPTVIPSDNPPLRQYTRRTRIDQSSFLPPVADEPAYPHGDGSQDQDRANIAKTSTVPRDSAPRITSLAVDEGSMQQKLDELTASCTSLQRQQSDLVSKFEAQELEITMLKARVKQLEDRERGVAKRSGDDAPIKGRSGVAEVPTGSGSIPTVGPPATGIPTGSDVVPTAGLIFASATVVTPYKRRKGKEKMIESETLKKKRIQEQMDIQMARQLEEEMEREAQRMNEQIARDAEIARLHAEEELQIMIDGLDRSNETIAKYLQEYHQFATELPIERIIELISDLVRYQDNYAKVHKYQTLQRKPRTKNQKKDYYMAIEDFILMSSKEETERFKRKGPRLEKVSEKKLKTSEEVPEEVPKDKRDGALVELKRLYEPDDEDQLWSHTQNLMHAPVEWKLYDTCRVHHVTSKDKEIFMLMEKDYPLRKGLAIVMISYKLEVENYSQMESDLILKIYKIANHPRQEDD